MQGSLDCIFDPDETHQDAQYKGKTYSTYIKERYEEIMRQTLSKIDNPISKKVLKNQLLEHSKYIVSKATKKELGLIRKARENTLISTLETLTYNCYSDPRLYESHKELALSAIKGALMPEDFANAYKIKAMQDLATSAVKSMLQKNPYTVLQECKDPKTWAKDCDVNLRDKFLNQAKHLIEHQEHLKEQKLKKLIPYHFESLLATGKGIEGISEFFTQKDAHFVVQEASYKKAYDVIKKLDDVPINEWEKEITKMAPQEEGFNSKSHQQAMQIASAVLKQKMLLAQNDPAALIEQENASLLDNTSDISERFLMREHLQKKKGIHNTKLLTTNERAAYAKELNELINSDNSEPQSLATKLQGLALRKMTMNYRCVLQMKYCTVKKLIQ